MDMKQCAQGGHYYDGKIHANCPYCNTADINATVALNRGVAAGDGNGDGDGRTVAVIKQSLGVDPVVGWLVSLDGEEKGKDYRIHADNNYIGRSAKMDICIGGDDTISRENHAIISYDTRAKTFYLSPGEGRSIIRLNDEAVFATTKITASDIIEIGKTRLRFVPFCDGNFEWD